MQNDLPCPIFLGRRRFERNGVPCSTHLWGLKIHPPFERVDLRVFIHLFGLLTCFLAPSVASTGSVQDPQLWTGGPWRESPAGYQLAVSYKHVRCWMFAAGGASCMSCCAHSSLLATVAGSDMLWPRRFECERKLSIPRAPSTFLGLWAGLRVFKYLPRSRGGAWSPTVAGIYICGILW